MADDDRPVRLTRLSDGFATGGVVRNPQDVLYASGGWCAPLTPLPMYDVTLRLCDSWDQDWNALVAPRFTRVQRWSRRHLSVRRWLQRRRSARRWRRLTRG